jgi:hypothetical protein
VVGRYLTPKGNALNEATITWQRSNWNPEPENPDVIGLDYQTVLRIGGRDTTQDFIQTRLSLRDDYTRFAHWNGAHTFKSGVVFSFLKYDVTKLLNGNPVFRFRQDEQFAFPFEAGYGVGNPDLSTNNRLDEKFRLQWGVRTFRFSLDGAPRNGQATIIWDLRSEPSQKLESRS